MWVVHVDPGTVVMVEAPDAETAKETAVRAGYKVRKVVDITPYETLMGD